MTGTRGLNPRSPHPGVRALWSIVASFALTTLLLLAVYANQDTSQPASTNPRSTGSAAALIELHDCWSGDAPADMRHKVPRHAVVTRPGSAQPEYVGGRTVDRALAHVFAGKRPDLTVHGFCR